MISRTITVNKNPLRAFVLALPAVFVLDAATIAANQGTVTLKGGDIAVNAVSEHHESRYEEKHKNRKATSSQKSEQRDYIDQNLAAGSAISGAAVNVDVDLRGGMTPGTRIIASNGDPSWDIRQPVI